MWPFFNRKRVSAEAQPKRQPRLRPLRFSQLIEGMGDLSDLGQHDSALKFWLPEPTADALKDLCMRSGESMPECVSLFGGEVVTVEIEDGP